MDDRRARPGQKRRHDEADAFAGSGWGEAQHMLGTVVAQIGAVPLAEQNAVMLQQPGASDLPGFGPARRAVGRDFLTSRARHTDMAIATTIAATPPDAAI